LFPSNPVGAKSATPSSASGPEEGTPSHLPPWRCAALDASRADEVPRFVTCLSEVNLRQVGLIDRQEPGTGASRSDRFLDVGPALDETDEISP
jgi:hypothetical protein